MTARPNVIFILSDQHNAKCLGHAGHPTVKTPSLDRLANEGTRFTSAYCQNPICTPSRISFLSGQYCHNHGYYGLSGPNPNGLPTILGHFRRQGYTTAAIGKIHCPEYWVEDDSDVFRETLGCSIGGRDGEYARFLEENGLVDQEDHAIETCPAPKVKTGQDGAPAPFDYALSQERWIVKESLAFMASTRTRETPFLLHVSFPKPHQSYSPAQAFWDLYPEDALFIPPNADHEDPHAPPHLKRRREAYRTGAWTRFEPHTFEAGRLRKLRGYLGNITQTDQAVGEILSWLDENHLAENTVVIYSSDHGDYAIEHGLMEKAPGICHDAICRIPFIWRWPSVIQPNTACDAPVESVDLATTLCALCDLPPLETGDGFDLTPTLKGQADGLSKEIALTEFAWSKSIRKGPWRLVWYPKTLFAEEYPDGYGQLYNLTDDPWEMRNLYFLPEFKEIVAALRHDLMELLVTTSRPKTTLGRSMPRSPQNITRYGHTVNDDGKQDIQTLGVRGHIDYL